MLKDDCASRNCAATINGDLVCCNEACDGGCESCGSDGYCDEWPNTDSRCNAIDCPDSTSCTAYPEDLVAGECHSFGQCFTEVTYCVANHVPSETSCGEVKTCDGAGNCECSTSAPCHSECPCGIGEGPCTTDDQCDSDLVCTTDAITKLGTQEASCMPAHCTNNSLDTAEGETSQDCGGECGCRATWEEISLTGAFDSFYVTAISGDGSTFVGYLYDGDDTRIAATIEATTGVVNTLESFAVGADAEARFVNEDGTVIAGFISCAQPVTGECEESDPLVSALWDGVESAPEWLFMFSGEVKGMSTTGNVLMYLDHASNPPEAVQYRRSTETYISTDMFYTAWSRWGMSGDGTMIWGTLSGTNLDSLWYPKTGEIVTPPYPDDWSDVAITSANMDGSVFVGSKVVNRESELAFISENGDIRVIDPPNSDMTQITANQIDSDGTRFVGSVNNAGVRETVLWDDDGGVRTLYNELVSRGLEFPPDVAEVPYGTLGVFISNDGKTIIGQYSDDLFWRAVLLD
jgi:uncharacterized membrane protein